MYPSASPKSACAWPGRWLNGTNISRVRSVVCATYSRTIVYPPENSRSPAVARKSDARCAAASCERCGHLQGWRRSTPCTAQASSKPVVHVAGYLRPPRLQPFELPLGVELLRISYVVVEHGIDGFANFATNAPDDRIDDLLLVFWLA